MKGFHLGEFEQLVLLATMRLGVKAYGMRIRLEIQTEGRRTSMGSVYAALDRLEAKGYVTSWLADSTLERGGRAKRFYSIEAKGVQASNNSLSLIERLAPPNNAVPDVAPTSRVHRKWHPCLKAT